MRAAFVFVIGIMIIYAAVVLIVPIAVAFGATWLAGRVANFKDVDKTKLFWKFYAITGVLIALVFLFLEGDLGAGLMAALVWPVGWALSILGAFNDEPENLIRAMQITPIIGYIVTLAYTVYEIARRTNEKISEEI